MTEAPENTRSAFDAALAYPIDGIELDVQMTRDGVLVLHHDADVAKITGDHTAIAEQTYAALAALDWGGWFSQSFRGERIVTLEDALERYAARVRLLVEIKTFEPDRRSGRSLDITRRVLETLERLDVQTDHVFLLSFDADVLREAGDGRWKLVLNCDVPASLSADEAERDTHLFAYSAPVTRIESSMTRMWHGSGKQVMTYSCNTPRDVDRAIATDCDVIMTDTPGWIFDYLRSRDLDR